MDVGSVAAGNFSEYDKKIQLSNLSDSTSKKLRNALNTNHSVVGHVLLSFALAGAMFSEMAAILFYLLVLKSKFKINILIPHMLAGVVGLSLLVLLSTVLIMVKIHRMNNGVENLIASKEFLIIKKFEYKAGDSTYNIQAFYENDVINKVFVYDSNNKYLSSFSNVVRTENFNIENANKTLTAVSTNDIMQRAGEITDFNFQAKIRPIFQVENGNLIMNLCRRYAEWISETKVDIKLSSADIIAFKENLLDPT